MKDSTYKSHVPVLNHPTQLQRRDLYLRIGFVSNIVVRAKKGRMEDVAALGSANTSVTKIR